MRTKTSAAREYFNFNIKDQKSSCKYCKDEIKGNKASNLKTHLKSKHIEKYDECVKKENQHNNLKRNQESETDGCSSAKKTKISNGSAKHASTSRSHTDGDMHTRNQKSVSEYYERKKASVVLDKDETLSGVVELVTANGRPFTLLEDSGFRKIIDPIFQKFGLTVNRHNISNLIHSKYESMKAQLSRLIDKQLVSIKIDCVTRMSRPFIGINLSVIKDGHPFIFTLAVRETEESHSSINLKAIILEELDKFGISIKQVYSITTDNAANMRCMIKLLNEEKQNAIHEEIIADNIVNINIDDMDAEIDIDGDALASDLLYQKLNSCDWGIDYIQGIKCAAHVLQLAVTDTLKNSFNEEITEPYLKFISDARSVSKALRTQTLFGLIQKYNTTCDREERVRKPTIDCATRWNSTYDMLRNLLKAKKFINIYEDAIPTIKLTKTQWKEIETIIMCLQPAARAMIALQYNTVTLSDSYKIFNITQMSLAKIAHPFAQTLIDNLQIRRSMLFEDEYGEVFQSILFLDPRFHWEMNDVDKIRAQTHLKMIFNKLSRLEKGDESVDSIECNDDEDDNLNPLDTSSAASTDDEDENEDSYERLLSNKYNNEKLITMPVPNFEAVCASYSPKRMSVKKNVVAYWKKQKNVLPDLFRVAEVVFAVPATEVSVERLFSQLHLVLSDLRYNLIDIHIREILFIKCNSLVFQQLEKLGIL